MAQIKEAKREIKLKVASAYQRDVGRGVVRLDKKAIRELNLQPGDIVEIIGTKNTAAVVLPAYPDDEGLGIIRMDGTTRKNAGVGLGDEVTVRKAEVKAAKKVIVAPAEPIQFGGDFVDWFHEILIGRPVISGDYIKVNISGQEITFLVTTTLPSGIVQITEFTNFYVIMKSSKSADTTSDIGKFKLEILSILKALELFDYSTEAKKKVVEQLKTRINEILEMKPDSNTLLMLGLYVFALEMIKSENFERLWEIEDL